MNKLAAAVLLFLVLVAAAETGGYVRQQKLLSKVDRATTRLGATDRIACQFINLDADVRAEQTNNSRRISLKSYNRFLGNTGTLLRLFDKALTKPHLSAAQRSGTLVFEQYILSQERVVAAQRLALQKNVVLSQKLVGQARALSGVLGCGSFQP